MNKILLVEEDKGVVQKIKERLSPSYEMFIAYDGRRGFEIAKDKIPDLIITDAVVPVMNGFEFCKAIKLDEGAKFIPIIVLTQKHRMEDSFRFLGIKDFLNKHLG